MSEERKPTTHEVVLPLFAVTSKPMTKKYRTLVADPPWAAIAKDPRRWDGEENDFNSYPTMTDSQLMTMPVGLWADDNAHLYLWAMNNNLPAAHRIAQAWGFDVKTVITWVKGRLSGGQIVSHIGLGHYYRNNTEHVLFCVRGSMPTISSDSPTAFIAPRREHSQKPEAFYDLVKHNSPGPYLDVFSRQQRLGWDTWGNECFIPDGLPTPEEMAGGAS